MTGGIVNTKTLVAQDLGEARKRLALVVSPRPRRKSHGSRNHPLALKVTGREARALRVMARELDVDSDTGAVLLRAFSLSEVVVMYDAHLEQRRSA